MPVDADALFAKRSEGRRIAYRDADAMLYALGIGMGRDPLCPDELPFVFEGPGLRTMPSFAAVLGLGMRSVELLDGVAIDWGRLVHGGQRLTIHHPLPAAAELIADGRVSEVVDKGPGRGAIITIAADARLADGTPLYTSESVLFARADGGFGGPSRSGSAPHPLPDRAPDAVSVARTRADQALLYRLCGDRNPLHADRGFARRAGFPRPILHGLCSYGIACRAVLATVCGHDPARIAAFDARFTAPVFPGETIHTDIWRDGDVVSFRSRIEARGVVSIDNGRCLLRG